MAQFYFSIHKLGHFLGLRKIDGYNKIGSIIAEYYCDSKYDEGILDVIICSTDNPQIAVDFVSKCSDLILTEVYNAIGYLQNDHYADKFYVAFLLALPFDEKSQSLVSDLPDHAARNYWNFFAIPN